MEYTPIIEEGPASYGAHVPELPGCVAAAETREEVAALIHEAIQLYIGRAQQGRPAGSGTPFEPLRFPCRSRCRIAKPTPAIQRWSSLGTNPRPWCTKSLVDTWQPGP